VTRCRVFLPLKPPPAVPATLSEEAQSLLRWYHAVCRVKWDNSKDFSTGGLKSFTQHGAGCAEMRLLMTLSGSSSRWYCNWEEGEENKIKKHGRKQDGEAHHGVKQSVFMHEWSCLKARLLRSPGGDQEEVRNVLRPRLMREFLLERNWVLLCGSEVLYYRSDSSCVHLSIFMCCPFILHYTSEVTIVLFTLHLRGNYCTIYSTPQR